MENQAEETRTDADRTPDSGTRETNSSYRIGLVTSDEKYRRNYGRYIFIALVILAILVVRIFQPNFGKNVEMDQGYAAYLNQDYLSQKALLINEGFTNISLVEIHDLQWSEAGKVNTVAGISIDGDMKFSYHQRFRDDAEVIIYYHDYILIPVSTDYQEFKRMSRDEAIALLKKDGFTNFHTEADADLVTGWLDEENGVKSITIDGEEYFSAGDMFRPECMVNITYHTYAESSE